MGVSIGELPGFKALAGSVNINVRTSTENFMVNVFTLADVLQREALRSTEAI